MPIIVSVISRKGGQGKSTLAVSLAAGAVSGKKPRSLQDCKAAVLVDCDSQGSASRWGLGAERFARLGALATVAALEWPPRPSGLPDVARLAAATTPEELVEIAVEKCLHDVLEVPGLRIVPSCPRVHVEQARRIVLDLPADVVIVDTGADCSTPLVRSVIAQSDYIVCPTTCGPWGFDAVEQVVEEIRSSGRSDLFSGGLLFVVSKRQRNKTHDVLEAKLRDGLGDLVSDVVIPLTTAIEHVSGGPQFLTARHALRNYAGDIWSRIMSDIHSRRRAA